MQILKHHTDDVFTWPDGAWCYCHELEGLAHRDLDDCHVYAFQSADWKSFMGSKELANV